MKRLKKMIIVLMVCALCMAMAATSVFAAGKRLNALSKDEVFDCIWKYIEQSNNGLTASLMYDECKAFVEQLEMPSKNYDTSDGYNDFKKWYDEKTGNKKILPYSDKIIAYLKEHPGANLELSGHGVYDLNVQVDTNENMNKSSDENIYLQYDSNNIDNAIIWTYNVDKNTFTGTDLNGSVLRTISNRGTVITKDNQETSKITSNNYEPSRNQVSKPVDTPKQSAVAAETSDQAIEELPVEEPKAVEETSTTVSESSDSNSNENNAVTIILIISCGIIISAVFASIIIRQKKKRSM